MAGESSALDSWIFQDQVRRDWLRGLKALAQGENVYIKLGALPAMQG